VSVSASDIVLYHAATQSDVDATPVGGAIDTLRRPDFTQVTAGDTVEAVSSNAGDTTQTLTIEARKADGTVVSETKTLTGTTAVVFSTIAAVDRILKAELSASTTGSITVRKNSAGATYRVIPAGERGFSAMHRKGTSSTSGAVDFYAKIFWKNTNGSNALLSAQVSESADPTGLVTFALANSGQRLRHRDEPSDRARLGDVRSTTPRRTSPAPTSPPAPRSASGLKLSLAQNNAAIRSTYTPQIAGSTT
jgi:hypothetical protein